MEKLFFNNERILKEKGECIMKKIYNYFTILILTGALIFSMNTISFAHCDSLGGPVIIAAQKALETNNIKLILLWVSQKDEAEIKKAFDKTIAVRKLNPQVKELADMYFFETLVRIHRAGEGFAYTGLKPASTDFGLAIPAADKSIVTGKLEPVAKLLTNTIHEELNEKFKHVTEKKKYDTDDIDAGREYVEAYVKYIHYVEGVYQASKSSTHGSNENETKAGKKDPCQHNE